VLAVAGKAFAEGGYAGASLNDIIRATGLTKGGFYFHFPSKEALALAVVARKEEEMRTQLLEAIGRHERGLDRLVAMLRGVCDVYKTDPDAKALDRLGTELENHPDLQARQYEPWLAAGAAMLREAQEQGDVRLDVDPEATALVVAAAFKGMTELVGQDDPDELRRRTEDIITLFLHGVAVRD
jgi:AcrR family transcriptional regulator